MNKAIIILTALLMIPTAVFAGDVKIKTKQTAGGQTTENTTYIKGKRQRMEMMDGVMVTIDQCDLRRDVRLNPAMKTYMVNAYGSEVTGSQRSVQQSVSVEAAKGGTMYVTTTIKDTGERKQIFGFTARHIIETIETETSPDACERAKSKMEIDAWVIDAEFGIGCSQDAPRPSYKSGGQVGCTDRIVSKTNGIGKSDYPVLQKMTMFDQNGKESMTMTQEVTEISRAALEPALFEVPADYREVKEASQLYTSAGSGLAMSPKINDASDAGLSYPGTTRPAMPQTIVRETATQAPARLGPKKPGTVRIGLAAVKTLGAGDGINPADLSSAIQNSLVQYLKGTRVEVVALDANLPAAQADEARQKECDLLLVATASHKKGSGGGFGFGKMLGQVVGQTGLGATGSTVGNIAAGMATTAIVTAANFSGNVKSKDEITLDIALRSTADGGSTLSRQFKAKAKADGEDIVTAVVEQAAQAIVTAAGR